MNIGILGTGTISQTIVNRLVELGYKVMMSSRKLDRIVALAATSRNKIIEDSQEMAKRKAKEKIARKKISAPKTPKPKNSKPKSPKPKNPKPKTLKPKASQAKASKPKPPKLDIKKPDGQTVSAPLMEGAVMGEGKPKQEKTIVIPAAKSPEPEIKESERQIVSIPVKEKVKEEPKKETHLPFPPQERSMDRIPTGEGASKHEGKPKQEKPIIRSAPYSPSSFGASSRRTNNMRTLGIGSIILLILVCGGFGINYFINNQQGTPATVSSPIDTPTLQPITSTSVPFTPTPQPTETPIPTQTDIPTPTTGIGLTIKGNDGVTLLFVPEGEFTMGSDTNADEQPIHKVTLDAFWIDQTEVTNAMYAKCVEANECRQPREVKSNTRPYYFYNVRFDNYPVISVSWNDAKAYCSWVGRRLPTEAEWEKAARGTDGRTYPWGNDKPKSNLLNLDISDTTEVGKYPEGASIYGVLDMSGNVWEWVADWYSGTYYQSSPSSNPLGPENPIGPDSGQLRVLRGGSWSSVDSDIRSAKRYENGQRFNNLLVGFRCSRGVSP